MNQFICSDVFSYYRWIDRESYYFRLMVKELLFNDCLKDIGKVLIFHEGMNIHYLYLNLINAPMKFVVSRIFITFTILAQFGNLYINVD